MARALPAWLRALLAVDRATLRLATLETIVRDELVFAAIPEHARAGIGETIYGAHAGYRPGGKIFDEGLFSWERRLFEHPAMPRRGRVLVGGAGAGREAHALLQRGWEVTAFEPCGLMVDALRTVVPDARRASYADLVRAAESREGPLSDLGDYDVVLLGWSSLAHVVEERERLAILRATRAIAKEALVVASFVHVEPTTDARERARRVVRACLRPLRPHAPPRPGEAFFPGGGFARTADVAELQRLTSGAGYEVLVRERRPCPHVLLRPR